MELSVKLPNISPEVNANIFSRLLFWWVLPFMKYASNHNLQIRDVYDTVEKDLAVRLTEELEKNWNEELKIGRIKNRTPCFSKAMLSTFGKSFLIYGILLMLQCVIIRTFYPIILSEYIIHFEIKTKDVIGWYMGSALVALAVLNTFIYHHAYVGSSYIGMRARIATSSLIQKKVLRLSQTSLKRTSLCKLNKLLTEDVKNIEAAAPYLHYLYITPVHFISSAYILFNFSGIASLVGLFLLLMVSIPQGYLSSLLKGIKVQLSICTNERVKHMKEILHGIRVIKIYGWEVPFEKIIEKSRVYELSAISKQIFIRCVSISTFMFIQSTAVFLTITTQILLGHVIATDVIFAQILIFFSLQQHVCYYLPESIERYADARTSIRKIEDFLTMEEKGEQLKVISCTKNTRKPGSIIVTAASARWGSQLVLQDINVRIKASSLNCIFGLPGSGKSSFLQMLLKELTPHSGRVDLIGTVSYASQKPWLFPSTVKNNILFGQPYNRHKYREVIRICALDVDFQKLPYGDRAMFMDKRVCGNIVLKEKISLARTIYKDADIYIIDNCFSSIDPQTERFIFKECMQKFLKNKTRIFVSCKFSYAKEANTILVFENGTVSRTLDREELTEEDFQYLNTKISTEKSDLTVSNLKTYADETDLSNYEFEQTPIAVNRRKCGYFDSLADFLKVPGKKYVVELVLIIFGLTQLSAGISDVCLLQWIRHSTKNFTHKIFPRDEYLSQNQTSGHSVYHRLIHDFLFGLDQNHTNYITIIETDASGETKIFGVYEKDLYITLYAMFIIICIILTVVRSLLFHALCMKASRVLHGKMFEKVLFSPMKFFENYSSGKILQRFSKDMDVINRLPPKNFTTLQMLSAMYGALLLIIFAIPSMILPMFLIGIMLYFLISCFVTTISGLQRLESNTKTPLQLFLSKSLLGVFTIRSAEAETVISETFESLLDQHTSVWSLILTCSEYFCFYLDIILILFLAVVTFFNVAVKTDHINSVYIGLAVTQCIVLTETLQVGIRENIEVLTQNSVVNRALEYTQLMTEKVNEATLVPKNWPYCGKIVFRNVYIKENDGVGSFLKNLNIVIKPAEKIGVVSRFPEEKWTIVNCLLRFVPVEGLIILDDVDTGQISLNKLRSTISVITQDPVLFSSSIRFNLDPLEYANDEMIWKSLEEVGLKTSIQSLSQPITDGGSNFSGSQKQLLCLARALLKNSKVLIVENSPNDMDSNSNNIMKKIIQEKFKNSTVITIANSINTIMGNDKILVIEDGKEVEYAHAYELLKNPGGYLSRIVKEAGPTEEKNLRRIAKENFDLRNLEIEFKFE